MLPEDLTLTLQDCRRYMNEAYGCKSRHGTPIHITLVPPFVSYKVDEEGHIILWIKNEIAQYISQ